LVVFVVWWRLWACVAASPHGVGSWSSMAEVAKCYCVVDKSLDGQPPRLSTVFGWLHTPLHVAPTVWYVVAEWRGKGRRACVKQGSCPQAGTASAQHKHML